MIQRKKSKAGMLGLWKRAYRTSETLLFKTIIPQNGILMQCDAQV